MEAPAQTSQSNLDPQRVAALQSLFPQNPQANAGAPPIAGAAPAQPPANPDADLRQTIQLQSQVGLGAFGEREKASMGIGDQIQQEQAQRSQIGPRAFSPNIVHGQGAGGFLHHLGQALLTVGAATRPGQAIQDVAYSRPREEYAERSKRIEELQAEQKGIQEPMSSAAQLAYKPYQAEASERKAGAAETTAKARADAVIMQHQTALDRIAGMKDITAKRNAITLEVQKMRNDIQRETTSMKDITQEDVARILAGSAQTLQNTKFAEDPDAWGMFKRAIGITPAQAPGGAQPVAGQTPLPSRTSKLAAKAAATGAAPARPSGVPSDYVYQEKGPKGKGWYRPGSK